MERKKLKTAIVGLGGEGMKLLSIANDSEYLDVCAVADNDGELAEKTARTYDCSGYYDYRQLIIQNQLDVVIVSEPMHLSIELIRLAIDRKCHVLKLPPAALDFEQVVELFRHSKKQGVKYVTANASCFSGGFKRLREFIEFEGVEKFHLISAVCNVAGDTDRPENRWLTDPGFAGGGVVLHNCYQLINQIIQNFNMPEKVYSLSVNNAPDKQQRVLTTEDSAVITMQFHDTQMANLTTSRTFGPFEQFLRLHTKDRFVTATTDRFIVSANNGEIISDSVYEAGAAEWTGDMLDDFALNVLEPNEYNSVVDPKFDLLTMAVIQSAYISAKTSMPEEPSRILQIAGV
jgi:predicted dehydrogenase